MYSSESHSLLSFQQTFLELSINEFIYTLTSLGAAAVNIQEYGKPVDEISRVTEPINRSTKKQYKWYRNSFNFHTVLL